MRDELERWSNMLVNFFCHLENCGYHTMALIANRRSGRIRDPHMNMSFR
jgi:hypothetical protein